MTQCVFVNSMYFSTDSRDSQTTYNEVKYVAQIDLENELARTKTITNMAVEEYFEYRDPKTGRYKMRPWLMEIYPRDVA